MLERMIALFIKRPLLLALGLILVLVAGIQGWQRMAVDLLPDLDVPVVNIITHLPGASPQDTELLLTRPIEAVMQGINGVHRVASTSAQGISHISVQFDWGTRVNEARQLVQARLGLLSASLPQGVSPRLEQIGTTLQEVAGYTITSPSDPVALLNAVRYRLMPRITQMKGVSFVDLLGGEQRAFVVRIKPEALMRLHLRLSDVTAALKATNRISLSGFASDGGREWLVRTDGRILTLEDLRRVAIQTPSLTRPLLLGEIASVHEGRAPKHYTVHGGGRPAVALLLRKQPGASAIDVMQSVDRELGHLQALLPAGAKIEKFYDQSEIIKRARSEIATDLGLGAMLVMLVLYLFLGRMRPALVVALTIPTTLLATLAIMQALGLSLNIVTMTALALAIGMIVDDAIIVAENIARHASDKPIHRAALDGAVEISGPDISGTLTTLAAFFPLLVVGGMAALFLRPFGWTLGAALLVSLMLSLLMVPVLTALPWFSAAKSSDNHAGIQSMQRLNSLAGQIMDWGLLHRRLVLLCATGLVLLAVILALFGRVSLLPPLDEGAILVEYIMPPGTALTESNRIGNTLEQIALKQPDVATVYRRTGSPVSGYQIEGVNRGEMMIKLKPLTKRQHSADAMMQQFRTLYAPFSGISFLFHQPTQEKMDESFSGLPALFGVTIFGDNEQTLIKLATQVESMLAGNPAISNIVNNTRVGSNRVTIHLRPEALAQYGLMPDDVMQAVRAAGLGVEATQVVRDQERFPILLRWDGPSMQQPERIGELPLPIANGGWIPLNRVADVESSAVAANITRLNGQRQITLLAEAEGNMLAIARSIQTQLDGMSLPEGYSATVSGQYPVLIDTIIEFSLTALAAAGLIYLIMVLQFGSWRQPLAILAVVPIALAGGMVAVELFGLGLDVSIGMGALTLIGIAVNNGIVLVDFANRGLAAGLLPAAAWRQAVHVRLRPVLMTALTTIASLLPIAVCIGGASEIFRPFSVMVIGGLLAATASTLMLLPLLLIKPEITDR